MSDLIERVARAMVAIQVDLDGLAPGTDDRDDAMSEIERNWKGCKVEARAAIREVAAWLDDALKDDDGRIYVPQFLRQAAGGGQMSDDLELVKVARQWKVSPFDDYAGKVVLVGQLCDAIERLTAEVAALKHDIARHMKIANDAEAEAARLREALERIKHLTRLKSTQRHQAVYECADAALRGEEGRPPPPPQGSE